MTSQNEKAADLKRSATGGIENLKQNLTPETVQQFRDQFGDALSMGNELVNTSVYPFLLEELGAEGIRKYSDLSEGSEAPPNLYVTTSLKFNGVKKMISDKFGDLFSVHSTTDIEEGGCVFTVNFKS